MASAKFSRAADNNAVAVRGFKELQATLGKIEDGTKDELKRRLQAIGDQVALVAASKAPRRTRELQHSIKSSVGPRSAAIYSDVIYGGAVNFGAYPHAGRSARGPHISRAAASHYMDRTVTELEPWIEEQVQALVDWVITTFEEG